MILTSLITALEPSCSGPCSQALHLITRKSELGS